MNTLIALTLTSMLCVVSPTMTHAEMPSENESAAETESLLQRFKDAILPGLHRSSGKPYSYLTPSIKPNHFRAPFKGGQSRLYVNDEHSPFVVDPHTPEGNIFEFRFWRQSYSSV